MKLLFNDRLRQARKEQNLTVEQLANKVGCSKSYISQLENGATKPSVTMLGKLVEALNVQITNFFQDNRGDVHEKNGQSNENSKITKFQCYVAEAERHTIDYPDGKTKSHFLTRAVYQKKMQPILTVIEPGGQSNTGDEIVHPQDSEEFLMIIKGELVFEANDQEFTLKQGDTFYFDGNIPHRWKNISSETTEVLFVWTPAVW